MSHSLVSEGIVLSARPYSDADKIVTVFTRDFGRIALLAKGVKRPKSRKRGSLEVASYIKFIAHRGHGMPIVTEVEILESFSEIRKDLKKVAVAYFFIEVVTRAMRDEEKNLEVYTLLLQYLIRLTQDDKLKALRRQFSIELAQELGFIPENQFVPDADEMIEAIIERKLGSVRVGKKLQL